MMDTQALIRDDHLGSSEQLSKALIIEISISFCRCSYQNAAMGKGEKRLINCTAPILGQYLFVILNKNERLMLCFVEVFALSGNYE